MSKYNLILKNGKWKGVEMANKPISLCSCIVVIECPFFFFFLISVLAFLHYEKFFFFFYGGNL